MTEFRNVKLLEDSDVANRIYLKFFLVRRILDIIKIKRLHRSESQLARIKPACRYLYRYFRNFDFVLDDESYFTFANTTLAGNDGIFSSDVSATENNVKLKTKKKFEEKVPVSLIISMIIENRLNKIDPKVANRYARMTSVRLGRIAFNDVIENQ